MLTQKRILFLLAAGFLLLFFMLPAGSLSAQDDVVIEGLLIMVWPEYDDRSALVFYRGITNAVSQPISIQLPEQARINAVAYEPASGGPLVDMPYDLSPDKLLTITPPEGVFHIEFYDDSFQVVRKQRSYELHWQSDYPVNALAWEVQQPLDANFMTITPEHTLLNQTESGLILYRSEHGALAAGEAFTLAVDYEKDSSALTLDLLEGRDTQSPLQGLLPDSVFNAGMWIFIAVLAATAGYFYGESRRNRRALDEMKQTRTGDPTDPQKTPPVKSPVVTAPLVDPLTQAFEDGLTRREIEVLRHVAEGMMNDEIGERLNISPKTVGRHRENIMRKLKLNRRTQLVKYALRIGLIRLSDE